jgi:hypothetical protein
VAVRPFFIFYFYFLFFSKVAPKARDANRSASVGGSSATGPLFLCSKECVVKKARDANRSASVGGSSATGPLCVCSKEGERREIEVPTHSCY